MVEPTQIVVTSRAVTALLSVMAGVLIGQVGVLAGLLIAVGVWMVLLAMGAYR